MRVWAVVLFTLAGAVALAAPKQRNYCLDFDGKTAVGKITEVAGFQALNNALKYTFEAWIKPRSQGGGGRGRILDQENSSLTFYLSDEGRLGFRPNREIGWQLSDAKAIKFWKWQHVAVTYDSKLLRFFVDGKLVTAYPVNAALSVTRKPVYIGNGVGDADSLRGFDGWIDDVRVSDVCRWTKDFSPPSRAEFVAPVSSSILVMPFDEGPAYDLALDYTCFNAEFRIEAPLRRVAISK